MRSMRETLAYRSALDRKSQFFPDANPAWRALPIAANRVGRISVVTVCLNARDSIRLTLESVASQTFANVEHVVIDGGSQDGTQAIVNEYPIGYFVSEKDGGVYSAMEKGARAASGDVLIFLNAGDTFYDERVCEEVAAFFNETRADIVFGNLMPVYLKASDTHDHGAFRPGQLLDLGYIRNRRQLYDESIHHQATFYRSWIFKRCSFLCEAPEASGEYHVLLNAVMKQHARVKHIPRPVARFALGGISTRDFTVEWSKFVKARNILRTLHMPDSDAIKPESETEFHHGRPKAARMRTGGKARIKQMIKNSFLFKSYERITLGFSSRIINLLIPKIDDMLEMQTQRVFSDLSHVIGKRHAQHEDLLRVQEVVLEDKIDRRLADIVARLEDGNRELRRLADIAEAGRHAGETSNRNLYRLGEQIQINLSAVADKVGGDDFSASGYRVFSQWNEDGLIQYLVSRAGVVNHTFVEIGVGDYSEANTRLLLQKNNWSGMIIDCGSRDMEKVRASELYWRYSLKAVDAFVDCDNVNRLLLENGMRGEIGLLSIDIDGVDYWVWNAISAISPQIVICEYNGIFGPHAAVTVPYDPQFDRTKKHYSWLYAGASLSALIRLGKKKGYTIVGTNGGGNNAFFVRDDVLARSAIKPMLNPFTRPMFREARNPDGSLSYLDIDAGIELIREMEVVDVERDAMVKIGDIAFTRQ